METKIKDQFKEIGQNITACNMSHKDIVELMKECENLKHQVFIKHDAKIEFPSKQEGWNHSKQVLVYCEGNAEIGKISKFDIAYYHYDPPFEDAPKWVGCSSSPSFWWDLPNI